MSNTIVDYLEFEGKQYPYKVLSVAHSGTHSNYKIATESLHDALRGGDPYADEVKNATAEGIENDIYYYIEDHLIFRPANEIAEKHLDIPMKLIKDLT